VVVARCNTKRISEKGKQNLENPQPVKVGAPPKPLSSISKAQRKVNKFQKHKKENKRKKIKTPRPKGASPKPLKKKTKCHKKKKKKKQKKTPGVKPKNPQIGQCPLFFAKMKRRADWITSWKTPGAGPKSHF